MPLPYSPWDVPLLSDPNHYSNFQCFLQTVTPSFPTQQPHHLPMSDDDDKQMLNFFSLTELWKIYHEWSCFGAGVPILLSSGDSVLQYYSPSLSAMQIYTRKPSDHSRLGIDCITKPETDSWSDDSDRDKISIFFSNNNNTFNSSSNSRTSYATSDDSHLTSDHETEVADCFHHLYCQYNETSRPHDRLPFTAKINELAQLYPGVVKFHSLELSPYSWMAVAWYPIYQIPFTRNARELSACFITYHALSSFQGLLSSLSEDSEKFQCLSTLGKKDGCNEPERDVSKVDITLPPFAVGTYKMQGELWTNPETSDEEKISSYLNAAKFWLKHCKFQHHDFDFFTSRR